MWENYLCKYTGNTCIFDVFVVANDVSNEKETTTITTIVDFNFHLGIEASLLVCQKPIISSDIYPCFFFFFFFCLRTLHDIKHQNSDSTFLWETPFWILVQHGPPCSALCKFFCFILTMYLYQEQNWCESGEVYLLFWHRAY